MLSLAILESSSKSVSSTRPRRFKLADVEAALERASESSAANSTRISTDSLMLNKVLNRSMLDLRILKSHNRKVEYFAAGIPWFAALFGRDSIITALQTLAYNPKIAEQTIRLLASYQGQKLDAWREEEPGKILHELRLGEMARNGEIPHTPYYGSIDSTPLFLVLVGEHARWTGDLSLFSQLRDNVEMALRWISDYGDFNRDGYVEYLGRSEKGLSNQGWKDSGDSIVNSDGSMATPPIALVEVQGYVYQAKMLMADLYNRAGEQQRAEQLITEADELKKRFNKDYWLEDGFYALAIHQGGRLANVLSSNAGHALWSGIAEPEKARQTAEHLMREYMFNGWGIRTLSGRELSFNPLGYHLGTVWPHDNSMIAAGMRRYGLDDLVLRVFGGIFEAAMSFDQNRLPELFGGFQRKDYGVPVVYPVTCQPQAWAAGSMPYFMTALLGLEPEAFDQRLRVVHPILPDFVRQVDIEGLRVGQSRIDLRFERSSERIKVEVLNLDGKLDLFVEN
jgi:glycogen debranching enzyme